MKTVFGYAVASVVVGFLGQLVRAAAGPDEGTLGDALEISANVLMGLGALIALSLGVALFVLSMRVSKD
ncbi:hypothetical protein OHQ88_33750 (plasmid) [Micromonospora zamorensis]|uniref:hypothetical protein n=1 Tax=Micromonospora zamorensis TaxID=709883 RepID=UPI002E202C95